MRNVSKIHNCYGCGVCSASCGKKIITIKLNNDGFYEPHITNQNECTECGICLDVCAFNHKERALTHDEINIKSYAGWSNDENVRRKCSSGGVGFELGKHLIKHGYKAVGCRYDTKEQRAEHYIASTAEEFIQSIGSKYIQSYTPEAIKQIKKCGEKYLVTGTPCLIDSFRWMILKFKCEKNFVLMDFFCHGVPSILLWKKYLKWAEEQVGPITYASWRNKFEYGWHDSWLMGMDGERSSKPVNWHDSYNLLIRGGKSFIQSRKSQGDPFYAAFLSDSCLGKQCYHDCKYKYDKSSADIRIGDLWGKTYKKDEKGVCAVVAFTPKGESILHELNCTFIPHPFEVVAESQIKRNPISGTLYKKVMKMLKDDDTSVTDISEVCERKRLHYIKVYRLTHPWYVVRRIYEIIFNK